MCFEVSTSDTRDDNRDDCLPRLPNELWQSCVRTEGEVKEKWSQLPDLYEARGLPSYYQLLGVATNGQFLDEGSDPPRINPAYLFLP
jgi:hypothetical protein